jgi:hypothetical protein
MAPMHKSEAWRSASKNPVVRSRLFEELPVDNKDLCSGARWILAAALLILPGCGTIGDASTPGDSTARAAENLPASFRSVDGAPLADGECRSPLIDPRDGTRLTMIRSLFGKGDYEVPLGKYGAGKGDLLRIDCANGVPVGLVSR